MQTLAGIFLLAFTFSLIAPFDSILAQETPEDEMMDEGMTDEEMTDEMTDEEMMPEVTMEEVPIVSPLKQMATGIEPHEIQCKSGQQLVFKASNWRPACVNESSYQILLERGWVSSHDPSHEDLTKMMEDYMATLPKETEEEVETGEEQIEIEEDVTVEEETNTGGNETETEPQSYTVELRESMEMGAQ